MQIYDQFESQMASNEEQQLEEQQFDNQGSFDEQGYQIDDVFQGT